MTLVRNMKLAPSTVTKIMVGDVEVHIQRLYDRNKASTENGKAAGGEAFVVSIQAPRDQKITLLEVPIGRKS